MSRVLADTSVWIARFRKPNPALQTLLAADQGLCHPVVLIEIACGTPPAPRKQTLSDLRQLRSATVPTTEETLALIEWEKPQSSGCGAIDLLLLGSVLLTSGAVLWPLDKHLAALAARFKVSFALTVPEQQRCPAPKARHLPPISDGASIPVFRKSREKLALNAQGEMPQPVHGPCFNVHTTNRMDIEFDAAKDRANYLKHGLSLRHAAELDWDTVLVRSDNRRDYGEAREIGYGLLGRRLCCAVFVRVADDRLRILSFRKANAREIKKYEEARNHPPDGA